MPLRTLGELALDGTPLHRPKPLLLLAYLAFEGATPRRRLAELFFGVTKDPADSLSTALKYLKHHPAAALEFRLGTVATGVECDAKLLLNAPRVLAMLSNSIIGLLGRRGYSSVKKAVEQFRAKPTLALDLISCAS